jgi:DNA-binding GntR family transcriptional regulator
VSVGGIHKTLRELVADAILKKILSGELQPGARLLEDKLAAELGVSRNPVRESIRALESTGLIEVIPRRGAYVAAANPHELAQLLEVRVVLEAHAAQLAAQRVTPELVAEIDRCIDGGIEASLRGDLLQAAEHHRDFHLTIEQAAGNPFIAETVSPLRTRTEVVFSMLSDSRGMLSWDEHRLIRDAIAAGDPDLASAKAGAHMQRVIGDLIEHAEST